MHVVYTVGASGSCAVNVRLVNRDAASVAGWRDRELTTGVYGWLIGNRRKPPPGAIFPRTVTLFRCFFLN